MNVSIFIINLIFIWNHEIDNEIQFNAPANHQSHVLSPKGKNMDETVSQTGQALHGDPWPEQMADPPPSSLRSKKHFGLLCWALNRFLAFLIASLI